MFLPLDFSEIQNLDLWLDHLGSQRWCGCSSLHCLYSKHTEDRSSATSWVKHGQHSSEEAEGPVKSVCFKKQTNQLRNQLWT